MGAQRMAYLLQRWGMAMAIDVALYCYKEVRLFLRQHVNVLKMFP